jgi:DNA-binding SARP family transcriptional activator
LVSCRDGDGDIKISVLGFTAQVLLEGLGDTRKARRYLGKARALLKKSANATQMILIEQKEAVLLESLGEKRRAFKIYARIIERIGDQYTHLVGSYFHNAAKVALDLGKISWAEECLNRGWSLCREYEDIFSRSMLEFGFGYLHLFKGRWDAAEKHLNAARRIFEEMHWSRSVCIAIRQQARLERYRGNQQQAMELLGLMKQMAPGQLDQTAVLLEQTLVEAARRNYPAAKEAFNACREKAAKYFGHMGEMFCALATAEIKAGTGHRKEAASSLRRAVGLGRDFGFDGLLSCELRASPLLAELAKTLKGEADYLLTIPSYANESPQPFPRERLSVSLFGPPRVKIDGREMPTLFRPQTLRLFCFLAYRGELGTARDEILEALWPKSGAKQAVDSFHLALHELRQNLRKPLGKQSAAAILKTEGRYRIDPEIGVTIDALEFDRLVEKARTAEKGGDNGGAVKLLDRAASLKTGPFCSGWTDDWAMSLARLYDDRQLKALLKIGFLSAKAGDPEAGREYYEKALSLDPLCEEACRGLFRIYAGMGRVSEAERLYTELSKKMKKDLGTTPSTETVELMKTLKQKTA